MSYNFEKEKDFCFDFIKKDKFLKQIYLRNYWGYQSYLQITGSTNSGKTYLGNWIYWVLTHGMYKQKPTLDDFFFSIEDLSKQISTIKMRCVRNNEAGKRGRNWNDKANELWSKVLQQQRINRNVYIDDLPHRKENSGIMNIHINYLITIDNHICNYLKKDVPGDEIDIDNIENYEIIRVANVFQYIVDYVGFNQYSAQNYFVIPKWIDSFRVPQFDKDSRCKNFWAFNQKEYMPYEIEGKAKLARLIEAETRANEAKKGKRRVKDIMETANMRNFL